ncbi:MAG: tetratricopeptide repeat protein [Thermoanaerobaculia bacterium]
MRRSLALCLLALVALASNAFAGAESRLTGKITDAATKAPIGDATIAVAAVEGKNIKLDSKSKKDGTYAVFLLDGTLRYKFTFSAPGYQPVENTMKLKIGSEPNTYDVALYSAEAAKAAAPAKIDPAITAFNEGAELANQGKVDEAIAKIETAVAAKPELTIGYQALGRLYMRNKNYPKAIANAEKAIAVDPDDADMNVVLAEACAATGDKAKAAEFKKKLPANPTELYNQAADLINSGKDSAAEPLLKQAVGLDEKFAAAYYELGMIYVRVGKNADAKTNLEKYLQLEPNGKEAATAKEMLKYVK